MYFGCVSDTIKVVNYTTKRTFPVNFFFRGSRHTMIKLILTLQTSATSIESPILATAYQFQIRIPNWQQAVGSFFEFRTGTQLPVRYSKILNHELTVSWSLSICFIGVATLRPCRPRPRTLFQKLKSKKVEELNWYRQIKCIYM